MHKPPSPRHAMTPETLILLGLAAARILLHFVTNATGGYGYFRDELYYLACADHLDAGYVDHPPFSIFVLAISRILFGDSLTMLRLVPALAGGAAVFLTGRIAARLGGGRTAQVLAALATFFSPILLGFSSIYSMNALDILFWTLAAAASIRLVQSGDRHWLIVLGFIIGVGAMNKIGMLWLAAGLLAGLLLSEHRRMLASREALAGIIIAVLCFLPFILWNILHDFAHLEFIRNATNGKYAGLSPLTFLRDQLLIHNPVSVPLWGAGIGMLLFSRSLRPYRHLGVAVLVVAAILLVNGHSKAEYLAAVYPVLFAAGAVGWERWTLTGIRRFVRPVAFGMLILGGIAFVPVTVPILPVETYVRYAAALGLTPHSAEGKAMGALPQFYADMFGWPEKAAAVAAVYNRLGPEDRARCAIFADNYGRAGAIDFFGRHYGLPSALGRHNNYWIWGPRNYTGELVIVLGGDLRDKQEIFEAVEMAGTVSSPWCMPYENDLTVYVCRGLRAPLRDFWGKLKHYD